MTTRGPRLRKSVCARAASITILDEVGKPHVITLFRDVRQFSFCDYFKEDDAIRYAWTACQRVWARPGAFVVPVFEGDEESPADEEAESSGKRSARPVNDPRFGRKDNFGRWATQALWAMQRDSLLHGR